MSTSPFNRPACCQALPFATTRLTTTSSDGEAPLKTTAFLCFQSSQRPRVRSTLNSFGLCTPDVLATHHSLRVSCVVGVHYGFPRAEHRVLQTVLANTHVRRMWSMVSSSWLQNGHASWCGRPRRASRSEVQHLFLMASQVKKRHLRGALDFQHKSAAGTTSLPENCAT